MVLAANMVVDLTLGKLRHKNHKFGSSLEYKINSRLIQTTQDLVIK